MLVQTRSIVKYLSLSLQSMWRDKIIQQLLMKTGGIYDKTIQKIGINLNWNLRNYIRQTYVYLIP